ncbi:DUF692 domain-containing protein [Vibrio viridaestus]|uniref:DUF692 domain-containing protein n=2 Tax=Vibrio viridaestus TaxID=2487322 RepID=A0A3N9TJE0_9VIBR|nr:DUF692 domain-containing protein [Vibrio viridaestus]
MSQSHVNFQGTDVVPCIFPEKSGVSLKPCHYEEVLATKPDVGFFEIHAENYLSEGGPARHFLEKVREIYPITVHGVGLSIGGENELNLQHLQKVKNLIEWVEPIVFSEHLAWSSHYQHFLNDLLPLPYNQQTLDSVCTHIDQIQTALKSTILLENPSTYISFKDQRFSETEFLAKVVEKTGCQLLLDVNNVEVSCFNHGRSTSEYLNSFPMSAVKQIHLAGYTLDKSEHLSLKIDSHNAPVADEVWQLFSDVQSNNPHIPTLIEWDSDIPPLKDLIAQAQLADQIIRSGR